MCLYVCSFVCFIVHCPDVDVFHFEFRISLNPRANRTRCQASSAYIHLIQRPCYQRGRRCQDPAGNWTTRRPPDDRKETQTAVVWPCFPFIRSGQNHLARHSERGKKTRQTEEEVGRQHQGLDRPGVRQVPEGSGEEEKLEKTGCKIICGAPTTLAVKGLMMMMMMNRVCKFWECHAYSAHYFDCCVMNCQNQNCCNVHLIHVVILTMLSNSHFVLFCFEEYFYLFLIDV